MTRFTDVSVDNKKLQPVGAYWMTDLVSLEESLENIAPQINGLERTIKTAKEYCYWPSEHGLTKDESAAVYLYTMEGGKNSFYLVLNNALRAEDRQLARPWFAYLKLLDSALNKLPNVAKIVWRGVPEHVGKNFKNDQELIWWTVNSCSSEMNIVQAFLGSQSTLFMIQATNAKDISAYTSYRNEHEMLLQPGTRLRVRGDISNTTGAMRVVHLIEVDKKTVERSDKNNDLPRRQEPPRSSAVCPVCGSYNVRFADRGNADRADADRALSRDDSSYIGRSTGFCFFLVDDCGTPYFCSKKH